MARNIHCQAIVLRSDFANSRFQLFPTWFVDSFEFEVLHDEIVLHVPSSFFRRRKRPRSCCPAEVLQTDLNRHSRFVSRVTYCYWLLLLSQTQLSALSAFSVQLSDSVGLSGWRCTSGSRPAAERKCGSPCACSCSWSTQTTSRRAYTEVGWNEKNEAEHVKASN